MAFQFTCPQGHLLEGDPAHAGMQSQCPMCGSAFVIPQPLPDAEAPAAYPSDAAAPEPQDPGAGFPGLHFGPSDQPAPQPQPEAVPAEAPPDVEAPDLGPPKDDPDRIVRIICPNGHELETPMSMVGSDAMCPHCSAQFRLRYEDSLEYQEAKEKERERREAAWSRSALNWAIVTAVIVILGLLGLMVISRLR